MDPKEKIQLKCHNNYNYNKMHFYKWTDGRLPPATVVGFFLFAPHNVQIATRKQRNTGKPNLLYVPSFSNTNWGRADRRTDNFCIPIFPFTSRRDKNGIFNNKL